MGDNFYVLSRGCVQITEDMTKIDNILPGGNNMLQPSILHFHIPNPNPNPNPNPKPNPKPTL